MKRTTALLLVLGVGCAACGGSVTEIFVCYGADAPLVASGATLSVHVVPFEGGIPLMDTDLGVATVEGESMGFLQSRFEGIDAMLTATTRTATITQRARVRFVADRIVDVSLRAEQACATVPCGADQTCAGGVCVTAEVPPDCLPDHGGMGGASCDPRTRMGCVAMRPDGG